MSAFNSDRVKIEFEREDYSTVVVVYLDGQEFYRWHDSACTDYPEDLTWGRMLGDLFAKGVTLGKVLGRD